jgi:quercetin dioxygenase-like cupin family protein
VTAGYGIVPYPDGPARKIERGDVVQCPPGEKHWCGAAPTTAMIHIVVQEALEGKAAAWMEKVSDEQYNAGSSTE